MTDTSTLIAIVVVMTGVTYATRILGVFAMRHVPLTPRVTSFLSGMANTVLVAVVVPIMVNGDWALRAGALVGVVTMVVSRNNLLSATAGVTTVALIRLWWPES